MRSYRLCSEKLLKTGFNPKFSISDAIEEIIEGHRSGKLLDLPNHYNVNWMDKNIIKSLQSAA